MSLSIQLVTNVVIIIAVLVFVGYRQLTWRAIDAGRMWRMPVILGIVGLATLGGTTKPQAITGVDIAVLLVELVISLGLGALMGMMATIRPLTADGVSLYRQAHANDRRPSTSVVTLETRTGWMGMALWVVLIAVRVGVDVLAGMAGSTLAASTGVILLMVAANRLARVAVILSRASRISAPAQV
ncbi:hypothetical protein [Planctomonas sp. JC2975]|uniref:hypothetical protein n=1 Tax=Planctomonas sp. JC2975 TaxID=2729626 RepID=UPI001F10703B|nr:hypothetical protein [Planctomonas sp. JC2975]